MKTLRGNLVAGKREKRRSKETREITKGAGRAVIGRSWRIRLRRPCERSLEEEEEPGCEVVGADNTLPEGSAFRGIN